MPAKKLVAQKAMDIHTPATAPAVGTSKPVIISGRPMAGDPMLNDAKPGSAAAASPAVDATQNATSSAEGAKHHEKTISPISTDSSEPVSEAPSDADADGTEPLSSSTVTEQATSSPDSGLNAPQALTAASTPAMQSFSSHFTDPAQSSTDNTVAETGPDDTSEAGTAIQEKTAEQMRADQLEELISKGTYHVSVNRTGRRNNATLAVLFIVLLALITLNLLLDMGVLNLPIPHTDFL